MDPIPLRAVSGSPRSAPAGSGARAPSRSHAECSRTSRSLRLRHEPSDAGAVTPGRCESVSSCAWHEYENMISSCRSHSHEAGDTSWCSNLDPVKVERHAAACREYRRSLPAELFARDAVAIAGEHPRRESTCAVRAFRAGRHRRRSRRHRDSPDRRTVPDETRRHMPAAAPRTHGPRAARLRRRRP